MDIPFTYYIAGGLSVGYIILAVVAVRSRLQLGSLQRWSLGGVAADPQATETDLQGALRRFTTYRWAVRLASLSATLALGTWLWQHHA